MKPRREGFAQRSQRLATRLSHLEALIRDGANGLLATPADQPALARACLRLFENDELRKRLGNAARATVEREFSLAAMVEKFAGVYEEVQKAPILFRRFAATRSHRSGALAAARCRTPLRWSVPSLFAVLESKLSFFPAPTGPVRIEAVSQSHPTFA